MDGVFATGLGELHVGALGLAAGVERLLVGERVGFVTVAHSNKKRRRQGKLMASETRPLNRQSNPKPNPSLGYGFASGPGSTSAASAQLQAQMRAQSQATALSRAAEDAQGGYVDMMMGMGISADTARQSLAACANDFVRSHRNSSLIVIAFCGKGREGGSEGGSEGGRAGSTSHHHAFP